MPVDITPRLLGAETDQGELQRLLTTMGDSTMENGVVEYGGLIRAYFDKDIRTHDGQHGRRRNSSSGTRRSPVCD